MSGRGEEKAAHHREFFVEDRRGAFERAFDDEMAVDAREFATAGAAGPGGEDMAAFVRPPGVEPFGGIEMDETEVRFRPEALPEMEEYFGDDAHLQGVDGIELCL